MTCADGNGLNDALRLSQYVPRPSTRRRKSAGGSACCRCDGEEAEPALEHLHRTRRTSPGQIRCRYSALRRPSRVQELRVGAVHPALQNAGGEAAADAGRPRCGVRIQSEQPTGQVRRAESAEEACRMETALVELTRADAADPARHFVTDGDGRQQLGARHRRRFLRVPARPPPTDCSCARSTRCACRRTRAPARRCRWQGPHSSPTRDPRCRAMVHGPPGDSATAASRVERPSGVSAPASDRPRMSSSRSFDACRTSSGRSARAKAMRPGSQVGGKRGQRVDFLRNRTPN